MEFYVENQTIRPDGIQPSIVSNSQEFVACRFGFGDSWAGLTAVALFAQGDNVYTQLLDDDGCCMLPVEIEAGQCSISVYGADGGDTTATTNAYTVTVVQAGYYGDALVPTADLYSQLLATMKATENATAQDAVDAHTAAETAVVAKSAAEEAYSAANSATIQCAEYATVTLTYKNAATEAQEGAEQSETAATQALSDLLAMITGGTLAVLVDGKVPIANIPATATQEIYVVDDVSELVELVAQRGDLAELVEDIDEVPTITKTWQLLGDDATVADDWIVWGTSYSVQAGSATYATSAGDAYTINGKRMVSMTAAEYDVAVLDDDTYYLVTGL